MLQIHYKRFGFLWAQNLKKVVVIFSAWVDILFFRLRDLLRLYRTTPVRNMLPKKPGPRSKTTPQGQAEDNQSSSSSGSSLSSGFLPRSGSRPQQVNQPQDPSGPSTSNYRPPGILRNAINPDQSQPRPENSSKRSDSGFVNRDDVTDSIRTGDHERAAQSGAKGNQTGSGGGGGGSSSSSNESRFLDDNSNDLSGKIDTSCNAISPAMLFQTLAAHNNDNGGNMKRTSGGLEDESDDNDNRVNPAPVVRQTARKSTAGRVIIKQPKKIYEDIPRKRQKTSTTPKPATPKVTAKQPARKKYRPGVKALQEIRKYQKSTNNLIPALPFSRLVREICQEVAGHRVGELRFQSAAIQVLNV